MKQFKKAAAVVLAVIMVFAMSSVAFAATVTISDDAILDGHTFSAYKIFAGKNNANTENQLVDIEWGNGINVTAFKNGIKADAALNAKFNGLSATATAADYAEVMSTLTNAEAEILAKIAYKCKIGTPTSLTEGENALADGYYLIVDNGPVDNGEAYNAAILQVTGNINITKKTDVPTVEKKVNEDDKTVNSGEYGDKYNDVADYDIGEDVPFHLIALVSDMSKYDAYKFVFHDTLSEGLTAPVVADIKVFVADNKAGTGATDITASANVAVEGQQITVTLNDLKKIDGVAQGKYIIVEYSAKLNEKAAIGLPGNPNEVYLEYSNNPNSTGTGRTETDKVIVFTYELDVTKIDGKETTKKLAGAEFKLQNADGKWAVVDANGKLTGWADAEKDGSVLTSDENGLFSVIGLDDGTYKLKETKAPVGYNLLNDLVTLTIKATTVNSQNWTTGVGADALTAIDVTVNGKTTNGNVTEGSVAIDVANNQGPVLPSTGGIGTTIFYVVGSILVLGAAILLIAKRRTNKAEA